METNKTTEILINKTLYPKTQRIGLGNKNRFLVTEKLDGSNLGIFKLNEDTLIIAQRNWVFNYNRDHTTTLNKNNAYKGLLGWLETHAVDLLDKLQPNAGFFGEWIGMGRINYGYRNEEVRMHIFAKANIRDNDGEYEAYNLYYNPALFIYPFIGQEIPEFLKVVPVVAKLDTPPTLEELDKLYIDRLYKWNIEYVEPTNSEDQILEQSKNHFEGFIVVDTQTNTILKYVRNKGGQIKPHEPGRQ